MPKLNWDANDFNNSQDSSGTTSDLISHGGNLQQGYRHGSLTEGLVAYYPMEKGEGEVLHDGALDNLGQIDGASWTSGTIGSHNLDFSGEDHYVGVPSLGKTLSGERGGFTLSTWIKFESFGNDWHPIMWLEQNYSVRLREDDGSRRSDGNRGVGLHINDGSGWTWNASVSTSSLSTGTWYHLVGIYDDSVGEVRFYLNGDQKGNDSTGRPNSSSGQNSLMAEAENDRRYRNGKLTDVRIYNRVLSEPEIKALFNEGNVVQSGVLKKEKDVPGQSEGGISRYKLNRNTDDSWGDNHGTNNGADLTATGVYGQAAEFNGSGDYIQTDTWNNLGFGDNAVHTISLWLNPNDVSSNYQRVFGTQKNNAGFVLFENLDSAGQLEMFYGDGSTVSRLEANDVLKQGNWVHVAVSYDDNNSFRLYVNGLLYGEKSNSYTGSSNNLNFGTDVSSQAYLDGKIDDVRIYDKALTPVQVEKLYHKGAYRISRESTLQ